MKSLNNFFSNLRRNKQKRRYEERTNASLRGTYLIDENTPFNVVEAFRNLKASISVAIHKKEDGSAISLLFTSNYPEEGKTTITVNLALMFAISNVKVVLIDADIRKGRISKYFKEQPVPGLSDYLSGQATFEEILRPSKENENLYVIYQGTPSPRPYELLESRAMKELSERLKKEFNYIIYDTPPIKLVSDALALVPATDGALLVCRHMETYESDIKTSLDSLRFAKANILGIVVNAHFVNPKKLKGNRKKYFNAYYSYGEGHSDPTKSNKDEKIAPPRTILSK